MLAQTQTPEPEYDYAWLNKELDRAKSKVFLGENAAFLGSIMSSLEFIWDPSIGTAATDGESFFWAPKDFMECTFDERVSTILHELWHCARLHMLRRGNRDHRRWNYACDIRINRDLVDEKYKIGDNWIQYHKEIPFELEEDIYDYLDKNQISPPPQQSKLIGDMKEPKPGNAPALVNNVVRAYHQATLAGCSPGGIKQIIDTFLAPVIPWESELQNWFTDLIEEDYSFRKRNRRFPDFCMPSIVTDEGRLEHLIYYLDVSGSISDQEVLRFNSEVKYIKETFNPKKLTLVQFDTRITEETVFEEDDPFEKIVVVGRGGTDLVPVREHIIKHQPTAAVIFTDLYVSPMRPLPFEIPILWVVTNTQKAPFGKTIRIKA